MRCSGPDQGFPGPAAMSAGRLFLRARWAVAAAKTAVGEGYPAWNAMVDS